MNNTQKGSRGSVRLKRAFSSSVIIGALGRMSAWIYRKLEASLFGGIFTSYKNENSTAKSSAVHDAYKHLELSRHAFVPVKRTVARTIENSAVLAFIKRVLTSLLSSSMKSYGIFMFSAALYSSIVYVFRVFYFGADEVKASHILTLVVMLISSVLMIASRQTLAGALTTSPMARFVLYSVIGIRRETLEEHKPRPDRFDIPFIAGLAFGIASIFVRPRMLLAAILCCVIAYLVLIKPEFGVLGIMICLPFAPANGLIAAVIYTFICFYIKVMCGKRSIKFDLLDATVLIFFILTAMGGLISTSSASLKTAYIYCAFMAGYFLVVNLIRSKEWVVRCVFGVIASCTVVSLYGLFQNFFGQGETLRYGTTLLGNIEGSVASTFESPGALAQYLTMTVPLILAALLVVNAPKGRLALVCGLAASCVCLICTSSRGAWIGFAIGIVTLMLMYSRKTVIALILGGCAIPFLPFVLPDSIINRFTSIADMSDGAIVYRLNIWRAISNLIGDYWHGGIGIGEEAFAGIYRLYSLPGFENAPHSYNLYMQILVELGIVGIIAFVAVIFIWAQSSFTLHTTERRSEKLYSAAVFCGILAMLVQGMMNYIWYNHRIFLMFWLLIGLGAAIRKTLEASAPEELF